MKLLLSILGFLNGGYMLLDGIYVMLKGKYIGPEKPGPWANLLSGLNIDPFKLGPVFIAFGLLWLAWLPGFWMRKSWSYAFGILISLLTFWYIPVGTIFAFIILMTLLFSKRKLGY